MNLCCLHTSGALFCHVGDGPQREIDESVAHRGKQCQRGSQRPLPLPPLTRLGLDK